jgi:hypothetical protein
MKGNPAAAGGAQRRVSRREHCRIAAMFASAFFWPEGSGSVVAEKRRASLKVPGCVGVPGNFLKNNTAVVNGTPERGSKGRLRC